MPAPPVGQAPVWGRLPCGAGSQPAAASEAAREFCKRRVCYRSPVACPYFQPVTRLDAGGWDPPPRLPLGDAWSGFCVALATGSFEPPEAVQRELCNCGYARGKCTYFPSESAADAVRFASQGLGMIYILEKDHAPAAFGEFREADHGVAIVAQARAFLESLTSNSESR